MPHPMTDTLLNILDIRSGSEHTHDPYDALCAMFTICDALSFLDPNAVPAAWGFRPSMCGSPNYATCEMDTETTECIWHGSECSTARTLLWECGVNLDEPYSDEYGQAAERALIELGNELNQYAVLYQG